LDSILRNKNKNNSNITASFEKPVNKVSDNEIYDDFAQIYVDLNNSSVIGTNSRENLSLKINENKI